MNKSSIATRLLLFIILISLVLSTATVTVLLWRNLERDKEDIRTRSELTYRAAEHAITQSLWDYDFKQRDKILNGMMKNKDIAGIFLAPEGGEPVALGVLPANIDGRQIIRRYHLYYQDRGNAQQVGEISLIIDFARAYEQLWHNSLIFLLFQIISVILISYSMIRLINSLLTRHLKHVTRFTSQLSLSDLDQVLTLTRKRRRKDELDVLVESINVMRNRMLHDMEQRIAAEKEVTRLNQNLEKTVEQRTEELQQSLRQLSATVSDLKSTQNQLVEQEKMASLGSLVAGIAHEINTPVGVAYTAACQLDETVNLLNQNFLAGKLTKNEFSEAVETLLDSNGIVSRNLQRAAELVRSFKLVAVDQSSDEVRQFKLKNYIESIILSLRPKLKRTQHEIQLDIADDLAIYSYPGAYSQIFTNLIINSLIHGFTNIDEGHIDIRVHQQGAQLLIDYQDDGQGISEEIRARIFDPFVTSNRQNGGSGLGTHIIYNLVTQMLGGRIELVDAECGVHFRITVPLAPHHTED